MKTYPLASMIGFFLVASVAALSTLVDAANVTAGFGNPRGAKQFVRSRVIGVSRADCKKCHASEVAAWMKTAHFLSADQRLIRYEGNTKKYAEALGIQPANLLTNSICADCHATKSIVNERMEVVSGVSCESCHGGSEGWLYKHQSYSETSPTPRFRETAEHRRARIKACDDAGLIRAENVYGMARKCFGCHLISDEKLIAAGHKAASSFELVSWTGGEVRHNFFLDKKSNHEISSLVQETIGTTPAKWSRVKFVVGTLTQIETALRLRANATNPVVIPQLGALVASANGKLTQINTVAGTEETRAVAGMVARLFGTLFISQPADKKRYGEAAKFVAICAERFAIFHDGSTLSALDPLVRELPPHYSHQYKERYLGR